MSGQINFVPLDPVSKQALTEHKLFSHGLGLPEIGDYPVADQLAVLGGSPSLADHVDELQAWDGEIWAINEAIMWCRDHDIDATFFAIDPLEDHSPLAPAITRAILADIVRPELFKTLLQQCAGIELFRMEDIAHGSAAASTAPAAALRRGHKHVTFFGCTQSFTTTTHLYKDAGHMKNYVWVNVDGEEFTTTSQNVMQAEVLSEMARLWPSFITVKGDGFLPALIQHGSYEVTHVCREIHEALKEQTHG
jgi:hypothetical protein